MDAGFYSLEFTVRAALAGMRCRTSQSWLLLAAIANENNV